MSLQQSHHHGHFVTALIDWEHAHDEAVKAFSIVLGIIVLMVALGFLASKMDTPTGPVYPLQYHYMPYY